MFQRFTSLCSHLLQCPALLTYNNTFLRFTFHINHSIDMDTLSIFLKLLHYHFYRIRNLLIIIKQNLLADNLGDKETRRFVCPLILTEIGGVNRAAIP